MSIWHKMVNGTAFEITYLYLGV